MKRSVLALLATLAAVPIIVAISSAQDRTPRLRPATQSSTVEEVRETILSALEYSRKNLRDKAGSYSERGALEFWSSGGLLHEITTDRSSDQYDALNIHAKHIEVLPLVEGRAAVAMYYSEGSMKPSGGNAVSHYCTRVTEVYVKEDGEWKLRAAHWSPVTGGSGTSQSAINE